jgi:hypothetical protein
MSIGYRQTRLCSDTTRSAWPRQVQLLPPPYAPKPQPSVTVEYLPGAVDTGDTLGPEEEAGVRKR